MAKSFDNINRLVVGELDISQDQKKSYKITMTGDALKFLHRSNASDSFVINKDGSVTLPVTMSSSPSSPASGGAVFVKSDGKLYFINSSGTEYDLTETAEAGGGSGDITGVSAGVGLSGGGVTGDVTVTLDVSELSALGTSPANSDYVVIQDVTDNSTKKVLVSNLIANTGDIQGVTAGTGLSGGGTSGTVSLTTNDSEIVHDNLSGFVANEHIDHSSVSISSGTGLSGGGTIASNQTLTLDLASVISSDAANKVLTSDGDGTLTAEANLSFNSSTLTVTGDIDLSGDIDVDGTLEADAITVNGTALDTHIAGVTVTNATTAAKATTVTVSADYDVSTTQFLLFSDAGDGSNGKTVRHDNGLSFNPGTNVFTVANLDIGGDVDIDGTLETDAFSINGTTITATATELNYVDGVTSAIQTQLNTNVANISTNSSDISTVSSQISTKAPIANPTFTGEIGIGSVNVSETELGILEGATLSTTELNYVDGVTSAIQAQLNTNAAGISTNSSNISTVSGQVSAKANIASPTFTGDVTFDTDTLFVDASDNDVRIGTTTALSNEKLHVRNSSAGAASGILISKGSSTGDEYLDLSIAATDLAQITAGAVSSGDCALAFRTSDTAEAERMRISAEGNVGIGTSSPKVPLDIYEMGGLVLAQTIIDGKSSTFSCESTSTTYKQVNDDTDNTKKASITFTVPASRKVLVNMNFTTRDYDGNEYIFRVRITDSDSESTEGSWGSDFNDEQLAGHWTTNFTTHVFQWYFDGTAAPHSWTAGDSKTMYFQLKVDGSSETVSIRAGNNYKPCVISAVAVASGVTLVDMG